MRTSIAILFLGLVPLAAPHPGAAQLAPVPAELDRLDFLVGEWAGEGWMELAPGQRAAFRGTERVERRMGGRLVVVEGDFVAPIGPDGAEVPVHQALGIFSYDPAAEAVAFRTYTARGPGGLGEVELGDDEVMWGYDDPDFGRIRYTITLTPDGRWNEVGHASRDGGETWHHFFEMTLSRR